MAKTTKTVKAVEKPHTNAAQLPSIGSTALISQLKKWGTSGHHFKGVQLILQAIDHAVNPDATKRNTTALNEIFKKDSPMQGAERRIANEILTKTTTGIVFDLKTKKFQLTDPEWTSTGQAMIEKVVSASTKLQSEYRMTKTATYALMGLETEKTVVTWNDELVTKKSEAIGKRLRKEGMSAEQLKVFIASLRNTFNKTEVD